MIAWLIAHQELVYGVLGGVGGYIVGLFNNIGNVKNDLAFIKGQLSQILQMAADVDKLKQRHVILYKDHEKTRKDLDAAHERLRRFAAQQQPR